LAPESTEIDAVSSRQANEKSINIERAPNGPNMMFQAEVLEMSFLRFCAVMVMCSLSLVATARAGDDDEKTRPDIRVNQLTATWNLHLGGSLNTLGTEAAWAPAGTGGAIIILENTLGLDEQVETFNLGATYRLNRRHSFELRATDLRRSATKILDDEIEWGDYVFRAEGTVTTGFNTTFVDALWKYDFSDSARLNSGFMAGFSVLWLGVSLEGEARLEDSDGSEWLEGAVEGADILAPIPVVGFYLDYAITKRWLVRFDTSALIEVSIGGHRARLRQVNLTGEYVLSDVVGIGLGAGSLGVMYGQNAGGEQLSVVYDVKSVVAYVSFAF
jgi:hypothetical protein